MGNSFTQWGMMKGNKINASLGELNPLTFLTSLDMQIPDVKLLPEEIDIVFDNFVRYKIFVGDVWDWEENDETDRTLKLNKLDTSLHLVDGIRKLLKRSEELHLRELFGGGTITAVSKLGREGFLRLKNLKVESSAEIEYIVNSMDLNTTPSSSYCCAFPVLETMCLNKLIKLQQLVCCHEHTQLAPGSFGRLRKLQLLLCG